MPKWIKPGAVQKKVAERATSAGRSVREYAKEKAYDSKEGKAVHLALMGAGDTAPDRPIPKSREEKRYGQV